MIAACSEGADLETVRQAAMKPRRSSLSITPGSGNFGQAGTFEYKTLDFTVSNTARTSTTVASVAIAPASATDFSIAADGCTGVALAARTGTCSVTVAFYPSSMGTKTASLVVTPAGGAGATAPLTGTVPALTITAQTSEFRATPLRLAAPPVLDFLVTNNRAEEVTMGPTTLGGTNPVDFSIEDFCQGQVLFGPGGQCFVRVRFVPRSAGAKSGSITVRNTRSPTPDVATAGVSGTAFEGQPQIVFTGFAPGAPPDWAFAPTAVGTMLVSYSSDGTTATGPLRLTVSNGGNGPTTPMAVTFENQPHDFAIFWGAFNTCASRILDPGTFCEMTVAFTPQAEGPRAARMRFASAAVGGSSANAIVANLTGTGSGVLGPARMTIAASAEPWRADVFNMSGTRTGQLSLGVSGPDAGDFQRHSDNCYQMMVVSPGACWVQLASARSTPGAKFGRLQVFDPDSGSVGLDLSASP